MVRNQMWRHIDCVDFRNMHFYCDKYRDYNTWYGWSYASSSFTTIRFVPDVAKEWLWRHNKGLDRRKKDLSIPIEI